MPSRRHDAGDLLAGRYLLQRWLGAGGMGTVWAAEDQRLHRPVAVKVVAGVHQDDPTAHQRFEREARTAARLVHPNLATVFDYGHDGDEVFLVMELLEGEPLDRRIGGAALPPAEVRAIGADVADGLAALHDAGIVHRDVKPSNVVLTDQGAKLVDFGIASGLGEPLTGTGMVVGTAAFLSPERVRGEAAGPPADVYALGAVLYEAATGHRAFAGATPSEVALSHLHGEPAGLSPDAAGGADAPVVPAELVQPLRRALAKDPEDRPSAGELGEVLDRGASAVDLAPPTVVDATSVAAPPPLVGAGGGGRAHTDLAGADDGGAGSRRLLPVLLGAVAGVLLVLLVAAWATTRGDRDGEVQAEPTIPESTTTTTEAPTTTVPPSTAPPTTSPPPTEAPLSPLDAALLAVQQAVEEGEEDGEMERRDARAILREAERAVDAAQRGDEERAFEHLDAADDRLEEAEDRERITDDRSSAVDQALSDLRGAVSDTIGDQQSSGGPGGGGPGGSSERDDD